MKDLEGYKIAASGATCSLFHIFRKDLQWLNINPEKIKFEFIPFDSMIPALEAGKVDGAILKGSYGVIAQRLGHNIPYIQWDVAAGDECCPAIISQTEFLLLSQKKSKSSVELLTRLLLASEKQGVSELNRVTSEKTGIPLKLVESLPLASFSTADDALLKLFEIHEQDERAEKNEPKNKL